MEIVLGVLTLIVGAIVPVWLHRRAHPKRQLRYRVDATRMLAGTTHSNSTLTIQSEGHIVRDPHAVRLTLWATGRADIPTSAFDSGRSIIVDLGTTILPGTLTKPTNVPADVNFEQISDHELALIPTLLPKTTHITVEVVTDAEPATSVHNPLVDIDLTIDEERPQADKIAVSRKRRGGTSLQITIGVTIAAFVVLVVSLGIYPLDPGVSAPLGGMALLVLMACAVAFVVIGIVRLVRFLQTLARR